MSGWERKLGLNQQLNTSSLSPDIFGEYEALESYKFRDVSDLKNWRLHRSMSDLSLADISSLDLPINMMEAVKVSPLGRRNTDMATHVPCSSSSDTSFNPLEYAVDDHCGRMSDCPDLGTLSGMLKYIKQEMKLSEASQAHSPDKNLWTEDGCQEKQVCLYFDFFFILLWHITRIVSRLIHMGVLCTLTNPGAFHYMGVIFKRVKYIVLIIFCDHVV